MSGNKGAKKALIEIYGERLYVRKSQDSRKNRTNGAG